MKCLVLLTILGVSLGLDIDAFRCDEETLLEEELSISEPVDDNELKAKFSIHVADSAGVGTFTYTPESTLLVNLTVYPDTARHSISKFMIVARSVAGGHPLGTWFPIEDGFKVESCGDAPSSVLHMEKNTLANERKFVLMPFRPPGNPNIQSFEFVATVQDSWHILTKNVRSVLITRKEPPMIVDPIPEIDPVEPPVDKEEEGPVDEHDPHIYPGEFEEGKKKVDTEVAGGTDNGDERKAPIEEDSSEGEKVAKKIEEEATFRDTHGVVEEERKAAEAERKRMESIRLEMDESENDYMREELERQREDELERDREMFEYERITAEQEKKRLEMIEWEIRDKEEHDRKMWEEEQKRIKEEKEKEKEINKTPKEEINVEEEIIIVEEKPAAGAAATAASWLLLLAALFYTLF